MLTYLSNYRYMYLIKNNIRIWLFLQKSAADTKSWCAATIDIACFASTFICSKTSALKNKPDKKPTFSQFKFLLKTDAKNAVLILYWVCNSLSMWSNYPFFIFLCPKIVSMKSQTPWTIQIVSVKFCPKIVFWKHSQIQKLVFFTS